MSDIKYYALEHGTSGRAGGAFRSIAGLRGCAWHVTVNAPSTQSAEIVANWQATQRGHVNGVPVYSGYNTLFDSDSTVHFWPDNRAPNGARGGDAFGKYNLTLIHLSFACMPDTWHKYVNWSALAYRQAAPERKRILDAYGWPLRLLTKSELASGKKGDITHHRLDPARRYDPAAIQDGKGSFDFNVLYGIIEGDTPPPITIPEEEMKDLKQGDEEKEVAQMVHLLNRFFAKTGGVPKDPRIKAADLTADGRLLQITNLFTGAVAAGVQHAIWRTEGWVLGFPIHAQEEGGSRVSTQTLTWLVKVTGDLEMGSVDTKPDSSLTQSGIDLKDAKALSEFVRTRAAVS